MDEQTMGGEVEVRLVGGPPDWAGSTLTYPRNDVYGPGAEPGALLISAHTPPRSDDQDTAPRAVYAPVEGGDPAVWGFVGWYPPADTDPTPADYLRAAVPQLWDPWPIAPHEMGDCPATSLGHPPLPHMGAACVLAAGHDGAHVASDGLRVVAVWPS
ncbi:hypothetical protein HNR12_005637 [Streptomonospora nanhaiensis]|uniref:Uncharacterized protein n=1 Tax=Streptomonospora nanhaiensis TaxID=1323731 RepID=A0A853BW23_9ACTN|nr:hypothetical protein [Streptomonospora nanhaiensis]NYI99283.1 hypothetical protein [Streptomonospora nanhaiensis]